MNSEIDGRKRRNRLAEISGSRKSLWSKLVRKFLNKEQRKDYDLKKLRERLQNENPLNVALGTGGDTYPGWIPTDVDFLDVTNAKDWERLFKPAQIDRMLAEHMFEHLSPEQNRIAFTFCLKYLKPGGTLRIAVPDGYRLDEPYHATIKPPADGHLSLHTVDSLPALLKEAGFEVKTYEYFDRNGQFHTDMWDENDGMIRRCKRHDRQQEFKHATLEGLYYTSLVVDAVKPR